jgi:hypothetical protein
MDGRQAGRRGSEVENEVYGVLVSQSGQPVAGARVKAVESSLPVGNMNDTDTVLTDVQGRYSFRGLPAGTYNLLGDFQSGALVVLIPGVSHADTLGPDSIGVDTLRAPGRIRGRLLLGRDGFGGGLAYLPGTSYLAVSDDSGTFLISGVPQGRYQVRYSASGFLIDPDTGVFVPAGATVDLPAKQLSYDPAQPPPAPKGLSAAFDTLLGRVSLSWHPVVVSDLEGYLVYRDMPGQVEPQLVPGGYTRDTSFVDSALGDPAAYAGGNIVYRVKARDKGANASLNFSAPAGAPSAARSMIESAISWIGRATGTDTAALGDTMSLIAAYSNPTRINRRLTWSFSGSGGSGETLAVRTIAGQSGRDTLRWKAEAEGDWIATLTVLDEGGSEWSAGASYSVVRNALRASASPDTTVSPGDSIVLTAAAASRFGRYKTWAWDLGGTGQFIAASAGRMAIRAPTDTDMYPCILRLVDAFGDTAWDTAMVRIVPDRPHVEARGDTTVSLGDSVRVAASASDGFGKVVRWEWLGCGDSAFHEAGPETVLAMPRSEESACPVVVRVTDDDGMIARDTIRVRIVADPPKASAAGDTVVSLGDSVRVRGGGTDGYGRIVKWEWRVGAGGAYREAQAETWLTMPREAAKGVPVTLRVTDDDGLTAEATVHVDVLEDAPTATAAGGGEVSLGDSLELRGSGSDLYGRVVGYAWACGPGAPFVAAAQGLWFGKAPASPDSDLACILRVTDDDGQVAYDTISFNVLADPPVASLAAAVASASPGDTVRLSSAQSGDRFGRIVRREWDIGAKGAFVAGGADTVITLPAATVPLPCVLRVTDDDGLSALDTVSIAVSLDPKVDAGADTTVAMGGFVSLRGRVRAGFGTVAKWEWDIGATGAFRSNASGDTLFQLAMATTSFRCVLRATNAAGYSGTDTVAVTVGGSGELHWQGFELPDTLVKMQATTPVEFRGKLWLLGGARQTYTNEIWASDDGISWVSRGHAAWTPRGGHALIEFGGRLWALGGTISASGNFGSSEVWSTSDGVVWNQTAVTSPFTSRANHRSFVFKGKMCVAGGDYRDGFSDASYRPDMWCSQDGSEWSRSAGLQMYVFNSQAQLIAMPDGRLLGASSSNVLSYSENAVDWTSVPTYPDYAMGSPYGLYIAGSETWLWADRYLYPGDGIWKIDSAGMARLTPGSGVSDLHSTRAFFQFQGRPWLWGGGTWDNPAKLRATVYRLKR